MTAEAVRPTEIGADPERGAFFPITLLATATRVAGTGNPAQE